MNSDVYFSSPVDLPPTQKVYPVTHAGDRLDIRQVEAGTENGTLKPEGPRRSHRSSNSSMTTQVTNVSSGGYPGVHTGLGTPMPWMNLHVRRFHEQNYGPPLPNVKEEKEEDLQEDQEEKKENKWRFTLIIVVWLLILAAIAIGVIVAVVLIDKKNDEDDDETSPLNRRTESFIASYEANLSLDNEVYSSELNDPDSSRASELSRYTCTKVKEIFDPVEEYAGCSVQTFRDVNGVVHVDLIVEMLFKVEVDIPVGIEGTAEESNRLNEALTKLRREKASTIRETFVGGVDAVVDMGNGQINTIPQSTRQL